MIYIVVFVLMAIAAWISYEIGNAPFEDDLYKKKDKTKTPK